MRVFLGLIVLLSMFLMAAFWQKGYTRRLQEQRDIEQGYSVHSTSADDRWVKLVLGRPSGAEPLAAPIHLQGTPPDPAPVDPGVPAPPTETDIEPDVTYVVQSNDVLGTICQERYGTANPKVIDAVALYNDLKDPNDLDLGQTLALPSLEVLFPKGP